MRGVLIDYDDAVRLVNDEIVKEGSDYVYKQVNFTCANVVKYSDGTIEGSCLVGRALIAAGIAPERFLETDTIDSEVFQVVDNLPELGMTTKAERFLATVQAKQDNGSTWGQAVEAALSVANDAECELDDTRF